MLRNKNDILKKYLKQKLKQSKNNGFVGIKCRFIILSNTTKLLT